MGDVTGDDYPDIVVASGDSGTPGTIQVYNGLTRKLISSYTPLGNFGGGLDVAVGDVNNSGHDDIVVGVLQGGWPVVTVLDGVTGKVVDQFLAFSKNFGGGVRVGAGDISGNGYADVVVGPGAGQHGLPVEAYSGQSIVTGTGTPQMLASFTPFPSSYTGAVSVAVGNVTSTSYADIVVGTQSSGAQFKLYSGAALSPKSPATSLFSQKAWATADNTGVKVALVPDAAGNGLDDLLVTDGSGSKTARYLNSDLTAEGWPTSDAEFFNAIPGVLSGVFLGTAAPAPTTITTPSVTVGLSNTNPTQFDTITATATTSNGDGDPVTLNYVWTDTTNPTAGPLGNGVLQTTSNTSATINTLNLASIAGVNIGDTILVSVTPTSRGYTGTTATTTATVQATTPSVTVALSNTTSTQYDITATATTSNADGDPVTLSYVWTDTTNPTAGPSGNGVLQTLSNTSATTNVLNLAGISGVNVGDTIQVSVTPISDGVTGTTATTTATVQATTPSVTVALSNTSPTVFDSITATLTPFNADGDPVTFYCMWTDLTRGAGDNLEIVDISSTTSVFNLAEIPADFSVGDTIQLSVTPISVGGQGTAVIATATVQAPSTPSVTVALSNTSPTLSDSITATATTSNTDGDPVALNYVWTDTTTGATLQTTSNTSATTDTLKLASLTGVNPGDTIQVSVTPASDGLTGAAASTTATVQAPQIGGSGGPVPVH